jgi:hypothetical protein
MKTGTPAKDMRGRSRGRALGDDVAESRERTAKKPIMRARNAVNNAIMQGAILIGPTAIRKSRNSPKTKGGGQF